MLLTLFSQNVQLLLCLKMLSCKCSNESVDFKSSVANLNEQILNFCTLCLITFFNVFQCNVFIKNKAILFLSSQLLVTVLLGLDLCEAVCGAIELTTHSVTVLEDFSRLKASWYLRLSTSFFIWGRSISSMAAA